METLQTRRHQLCTKFTIKATKHEKYSTWFEENNPVNQRRTKSITSKFKSVQTRTKRYKNSPLPFITELANNYYNQA